MTGKLIVNMTINGVGYYRHEVGHPVLKTTQVRETSEAAAIKCLICSCGLDFVLLIGEQRIN